MTLTPITFKSHEVFNPIKVVKIDRNRAVFLTFSVSFFIFFLIIFICWKRTRLFLLSKYKTKKNCQPALFYVWNILRQNCSSANLRRKWFPVIFTPLKLVHGQNVPNVNTSDFSDFLRNIFGGLLSDTFFWNCLFLRREPFSTNVRY